MLLSLSEVNFTKYYLLSSFIQQLSDKAAFDTSVFVAEHSGSQPFLHTVIIYSTMCKLQTIMCNIKLEALECFHSTDGSNKSVTQPLTT